MNESGMNTCICCCFTFWFYLNVYFFWFAGLSFKRNRKTTRAMCLPAWWRCIWRHKLAQCPSEWGWLLRRLLLLKRPFLSTNLLLKTLAICGVDQDSRRTLKCLLACFILKWFLLRRVEKVNFGCMKICSPSYHTKYCSSCLWLRSG